MYTQFIQRVVSKRISDEKIAAQVDYILQRGLAGSRGKTWTATKEQYPTVPVTGGYLFKFKLVFEKIRGRGRNDETEYNQWQDIKAMVEMTGAATRFKEPWLLVSEETGNRMDSTTVAPATRGALDVTYDRVPQLAVETPDPEPQSFQQVISEIDKFITDIGGVREVQPFGPAQTWGQLEVPDDLLGPDSDQHLARHPAWENLYGVNPQIRILLSNIKRAKDTDGESRNHAVLFGHAGCGKTTTMFALEKMFGTGSVLKLDATSTTKAGIEKLFFDDLQEIPPLVFMEEAEKADPEALKIWLGALDDRGEIRKVNFRTNKLRAVKVLFICSVNNKATFDKMMGSDGTEAGALSSRCVTQVYFPRPSDAVLMQILDKEIREKGGRQEWIAPAIAMAKDLKITDPRIVRSYLAGGERLLNGSYQRDWKLVSDAQATFNNKG